MCHASRAPGEGRANADYVNAYILHYSIYPLHLRRAIPFPRSLTLPLYPALTSDPVLSSFFVWMSDNLSLFLLCHVWEWYGSPTLFRAILTFSLSRRTFSLFHFLSTVIMYFQQGCGRNKMLCSSSRATNIRHSSGIVIASTVDSPLPLFKRCHGSLGTTCHSRWSDDWFIFRSVFTSRQVIYPIRPKFFRLYLNMWYKFRLAGFGSSLSVSV